MFNKNYLTNNSKYPPIMGQTKYQSTPKNHNFEPRLTLHSLSSFPVKQKSKNIFTSTQQQGGMRMKQVSMQQIKNKLKEYLNKTQQNSLLNYHNQSTPQFIKKSIHQHFRTTLFRNNIKKKANLKIIENGLTQRYQSPEFSVSQACINPRNQMQLDISNKLFHPKKQYQIHQNHRHKKQKIPIPKLIRPPSKVYNLRRESSFNQKGRVEPWKGWGRESEQGEMQNDL